MCSFEVDPPTVDTGQRTEGARHRDGGSPPTFHGGAHSSGGFHRPVGDVRPPGVVEPCDALLRAVVPCLAAGAEHQTIGGALPRALFPCLAAGAELQMIGDALLRAAVRCLAAGAERRLRLECSADIADMSEHKFVGKEKDKTSAIFHGVSTQSCGELNDIMLLQKLTLAFTAKTRVLQTECAQKL